MSSRTIPSRIRSWRDRRTEVHPNLRPLVPHVDPAVDAVFDGLSPRSRYLRFHAPTPRLTAAARRSLLDVDGVTRVGIVAEVATRRGTAAVPVGIGRLLRRDARSAELAVAVADAWQHRGIGRRLLVSLGEVGRALGCTELVGDVLPENVTVLRLLRSVFPAMRATCDDGVVHVRCPLDRPASGVTDEDVLADLLS